MVLLSAPPRLSLTSISLHGRGGRVIPLYRDAAAREPNVTRGVLDVLAAEYGAKPSAEDFAAYSYAVLGGQSFTQPVLE